MIGRFEMEKFKTMGAWPVLFLAIISGTIFLTINSVWLYWLNLKTTTVLTDVGLSLSQMMGNYGHLLAYLELPWVRQLSLPDFTDSVNGLEHFREVKALFLVNNFVFLVTIGPAIAFLRRLVQRGQQWRLIQPFSIGALVPVVLGVIMAIDFNRFFVIFHTLLFRNSDWLFDPQLDPIILALPEPFFAQCFCLAFGIFELVMLVGIWRGRVAVKKL